MLEVVDEDEVEIARFQSEAEYLITDKRIYIEKRNKNTVSEKIISLDAINFVEYEHTHISMFLAIAFLGVVIIAIAAALYFMFSLELFIVLPCAAVGLILLLVGAIKYSKSKLEFFIISINNELHKIALKSMSASRVREIQHEIFSALDKLKGRG